MPEPCRCFCSLPERGVEVLLPGVPPGRLSFGSGDLLGVRGVPLVCGERGVPFVFGEAGMFFACAALRCGGDFAGGERTADFGLAVTASFGTGLREADDMMDDAEERSDVVRERAGDLVISESSVSECGVAGGFSNMVTGRACSLTADGRLEDTTEGAVSDFVMAAEVDEVDFAGLNELPAFAPFVGTERRREGAGIDDEGRCVREGEGMGVALGDRLLDAVERVPMGDRLLDAVESVPLRTVVFPLAVLDREWPRGLRIEDTDREALVDFEALGSFTGPEEETRVDDWENRVEVSDGVVGVLKDVGGRASDLLLSVEAMAFRRF